MPPCGTTYKLAISRDPEQKYLYVADGTNNSVWILDRQSGKTLGLVRRQRPLRRTAALDQRDRHGLEGEHLHGRGRTGEADPEVRAGMEVGSRGLQATGYRLQATGYGLRADSRILDRDAFFSRSDDPGLRSRSEV